MFAFVAIKNSDSLTNACFNTLYELSSKSRQEKTMRFRDRNDRCRSIIGEMVVYHGLKEFYGLNMRGKPMEFEMNGKPFFPGLPIQFNVSHSGEWVVCGFDMCEIGVDIERIKFVEPTIAQRFFSNLEIQRLDAMKSESERVDLFHRIWAMKESYIKALGLGLVCPLDSFSCLPSSSGNVVELEIHCEGLPVRNLGLLNDFPGYACAVCTEGPLPSFTPMVLSPEELAFTMVNAWTLSLRAPSQS